MGDVPQSEKDAMEFLAMLRVQWPKRFETEEAEDQWLDLMVGELKGFSKRVLDEAVRTLMRKRLRGFPLLGECVDACVEAKRFLEFKQPELKSPEERERDSKDRAGNYWSFAWEQIRLSPMAKQAAREGWISMLFWFLVREGRLPDTEGGKIVDKGEIRAMKAGAEEFERSLYPQVERADNPLRLLPEHQAAFAKLARSMLARREALAAYVLEGKPMPNGVRP